MKKAKKIKAKTRKVIAKRVQRTKGGKASGKIIKHHAMKNHFNGRKSAKTKRNNRRDVSTSKSDVRNIARNI